MSAPKLLAIETSSAAGSVALSLGDGAIGERTIASPREQTARVLGLVDELLAEAGIGLDALDALAFGRGPGSFTGLRVAAAVAQGLSFAAGTPIVGVSSLAALALRAFGAGAQDGAGAASARARLALCAVDARMGEIYSGSYRRSPDGLVALDGVEWIGAPERVSEIVAAEPFLAVGDGFARYGDALAGVAARAVAVEPGLGPRACDLVPLAAVEIAAGRFLPLEAALPVYLRGADAWRRF